MVFGEVIFDKVSNSRCVMSTRDAEKGLELQSGRFCILTAFRKSVGELETKTETEKRFYKLIHRKMLIMRHRCKQTNFFQTGQKKKEVL
jgi:hypothetical protein